MDWSDKDQWDWMGFKKRNLMSLWKGLMSLCMVWLNCLFAILFFFVWLFYWGVCQNVCCCICFYSWGLCSPCISLSPYSTCKDVFFFEYSIFVLTPSSLPFLSPPSSYSAEGSICQSRHSCFEAGETNYHKPQKYSLHQLPALKAPLPLTHPAGDWGVRYLTDQEYWELHRTL